MALELQIIAAVLIDQLLGDPRRFPHPVKLIGRLALYLEPLSRKRLPNQYAAGILTVFGVLFCTAGAAIGFLELFAFLHPLAGIAASVFLIYTTIALKDLTIHGKAVHAALQLSDLVRAGQKVAMMVGRDTETMQEEDICRACVESVAENLVDGVTAPLFYAMFFGPVGALLYKAINTLDSTFGYRNEKYARFGWAAARLDDLANFAPARLTAMLVPVASFMLKMRTQDSWRIFRRDRNNHPSPNTGQTEAAVAGALGLQFGGLNHYFGQPIEKPTIGDPMMPATPQHIILANRISFVVTILVVLLFLFFS